MTTSTTKIAPSGEGRNNTTSEPTPAHRPTSPRPWYVSTYDEKEVQRWFAAADTYREARRGAFLYLRAHLVERIEGHRPVDLVSRARNLGQEGVDDLAAQVERARRLVEALPIEAAMAEIMISRVARHTAAEVAAHVDQAIDEMAVCRAQEVGLVSDDEDEVIAEVATWPLEERRRRARDFALARIGEVERDLDKLLAGEASS